MNISPGRNNQERRFPLSEGRPGASGIIEAIDGPEPLRQRLGALGIRPGLSVRVVRRAPFRGPVEIAVRNIHLGLRFEDAAWILLRSSGDNL